VTSGPASPPHRVYNLGNNRSEKLLRFIGILEQELGVKAKLDLQPMQPGDVPETYADIAASERDLGFKPKVPIVVRLEGTNVELGKKMLAESGLNIIAAADMADGAQKAVKAAGGSK